MVKIVLLRHGETDWNKQEIFRGRADVDLNERGREQARAVATALRNVRINAIYSSPLRRAVETAETIAAPHRLEVRIDDGFIDFDYGAWQGLSHNEVQRRYSKLYKAWLEKPHTVRLEGGESLRSVRRRAMRSLQSIVERDDGDTVVIVSHRVVNKVILCSVLELGNSRFWHIRQDTCALNIFEWSRDGYTMRLLNDTCHLRCIQGAELSDF